MIKCRCRWAKKIEAWTVSRHRSDWKVRSNKISICDNRHSKLESVYRQWIMTRDLIRSRTKFNEETTCSKQLEETFVSPIRQSGCRSSNRICSVSFCVLLEISSCRGFAKRQGATDHSTDTDRRFRRRHADQLPQSCRFGFYPTVRFLLIARVAHFSRKT